jgi:hypothetical protein
VEKGSAKIWATSVIFVETALGKQWPNKQKFAESGRPECQHESEERTTEGNLTQDRVQTENRRGTSRQIKFGQIGLEPGLPDFSWYDIPKREKTTK